MALLVGFTILEGTISDRTSAFGITVGLVVVAGALPFSAGLVMLTERSDPRLSAALLGFAYAAAIALVVAYLPQLAATHQDGPAALALSLFGAATLLGGALLTAAASDLRSLAARGRWPMPDSPWLRWPRQAGPGPPASCWWRWS